MNLQTIKPLRHTDFSPLENPSGEKLLLRSQPPFDIWIPKNPIIVLGNSQLPEVELNPNAVIEDTIPVYKRMSGGGAVLLSGGCLCVALRFVKQKQLHIHDYFKMGSGLIQSVVKQEYNIELQAKGISDLVYEEKKVSGCALYMPKDYVLYLISILIDPNFEDIEKYLAHPSKEPEYRFKRTHSDFLIGLKSIVEGRNKNFETNEFRSDLKNQITEEMTNQLDWALTLQ